MTVSDEPTITTVIADAGKVVGSKLDELHRGITRTRRLFADPWIRFGTALAVGYVLGSHEQREAFARAREHPPETILHEVLRTALRTLAISTIRRVISLPSSPRWRSAHDVPQDRSSSSTRWS